jgi:hypothetical protein
MRRSSKDATVENPAHIVKARGSDINVSLNKLISATNAAIPMKRAISMIIPGIFDLGGGYIVAGRE